MFMYIENNVYIYMIYAYVNPGVLNGSSNDRFITLNGPFFNDPLNDRYVSKE